VYDIEVERLDKVRNTLKRYLTWIQNSVFEGEADEGTYAAMLADVREIIDADHDQVVIYRLNSAQSFKREILGLEIVDLGFII
jgi:CRISPR-associated protein Cas2